MLDIIKDIDMLLSNYQNILNLLVAIGTVGAVFCSIYYSQLSLKPKLKSSIFISDLYLPNMNNTYSKSKKEYITLQICNNGHIPVYLSYFSFIWEFKFSKSSWLQQPLDLKVLNNGYEILPHKSLTINLCESEEFIKQLKNMLIEKKYNKTLLRFIKFKIIALDGTCFKVKINKNFISYILNKI